VTQSQAQGLSTPEAARKLEAFGPNDIDRAAPPTAGAIALGQIASPLVLVLLGAVVVSALVGEYVDALAITSIVALNAIVGFVQEFRAERAAAALGDLTARRARVVRDGQVVLVAARELVPGDLLVLESGDVVGADARLVEASGLTTTEAMLTGESTPTKKSVSPDAGDPSQPRSARVFMGTEVTAGTGRARVEQTGAKTEMGGIAAMLAEAHDSSTPLQDRMAALGRVIVAACVGCVGLVALFGAIGGTGWFELLMTSTSLAVAAIPEGLPVVVTIALAVGVRRMTTRSVLVRRLASVETLGCATVICTDKTGTLTRGVMEVREVWGAPRDELLSIAAAACDPGLTADDVAGDPTEMAILRAAPADGQHCRAAAVSVEPFDPRTRRMIVQRNDGQAYVKGAVEVISALTPDPPEGLEQAHEAFAKRGLRVLAIAQGDPEAPRFVGLVGMADPPREDAKLAIAQAHRAGVRVVMITGDHPDTAHAIAAELGLVQAGQDVETAVVARATAADKLAIVQKLRDGGEVVAMTGDGVNDAPAIRAADIGIAMGKTATEVTREASDMILTQDNLGGLIHAIREGRVIFANIRKTAIYLLGGNAAELLFVLAAVTVGLPLPLLPLQLLWLNLLGEPLPGIALALDPPSGDVLEEQPRKRRESILRPVDWSEIAVVAVFHAAIVLGVYSWALRVHDLGTARTLAFCALVFGIVLRALAGRSPTKTFFEQGATSNLKLSLVVAASVGLQLLIVYVPVAQRLFDLTPLSLPLLMLAFGLGLIPVTGRELVKLARRLRSGLGDAATTGA